MFEPLSRLHFGNDYPGANINCRTIKSDEELAQLAASIKEEGLIQSLFAIPDPTDGTRLYIVAGNRRLAALHLLLANKAVTEDYPVPVIICDGLSPTEALRLSLTENTDHLPLHPVDRFDAFAAVFSDGASPAEIAARYAVDERTVKQALALGKLAPEIRQAWREDKIDADEAQAFTLVTDHVEQEKLFKRLKKSGHLQDWNIKRAIVGEQHNVNASLLFVGTDAYKEAGGTIITDLFNDTLFVADLALLEKMTAEKIKEKCDELVANGWGWAENETNVPQGAKWQWARIKQPKKNAAMADKERSGCIVGIDSNGMFKIEYGVLKPSGKKQKEATKKKADENEKASSLSMSLNADLSETLTLAAAEAVRADSKLALAVLVSAFLKINSAAHAHVHGMMTLDADGQEQSLDDILKLSSADVTRILTEVAACTIDMRTQGHKGVLESSDNIALCKALPQSVFQKELVQNFDAGSFLLRAPKNVLISAAADLFDKKAAEALAQKPNKEIAEKLKAIIQKKGWLPVELRTDGYKGPKL